MSALLITHAGALFSLQALDFPLHHALWSVHHACIPTIVSIDKAIKFIAALRIFNTVEFQSVCKYCLEYIKIFIAHLDIICYVSKGLLKAVTLRAI